MKEFSQSSRDNITEVKQQHLKKTTMGGTLHVQPGHTVFEFDLEARDIHPAEYEEINVDFLAAQKGEIAKRKKLIMKPGCLYVGALNRKNAKKKFMKILMHTVG